VRHEDRPQARSHYAARIFHSSPAWLTTLQLLLPVGFGVIPKSRVFTSGTRDLPQAQTSG